MLTIKNTIIMKSDHRSFIVIGDTERFGKGVVLYESYKKADCLKYISKHNTDYAGGVSRYYRVFFEQSHVRWEEHYHMDVLATNAKTACDTARYFVRGFHPFHLRAERIEEPGDLNTQVHD